jgi:hypothetical protein
MFKLDRARCRAVVIGAGAGWLIASMIGCGGEVAASPEEAEGTLALTGSYVGCFTDGWDRMLPELLAEGSTASACTDLARTRGHRYAGLQYYGQCWAGDELGRAGHHQVSDAECDTRCYDGSLCGGTWRNSVWEVGGGGGGSSDGWLCRVKSTVNHRQDAYPACNPLTQEQLGERVVGSRDACGQYVFEVGHAYCERLRLGAAGANPVRLSTLFAREHSERMFYCEGVPERCD